MKYLTFGFDDCEIYDRTLCSLFRKYGMKATFFLISDQLGFKCDFNRYGEDTVVERVSPGEIAETYKGMEVATHTAAHKCPVDDLENSVFRSAEYLSELCGYTVKGMAYPGGAYTDEHIKRLKNSRIAYSRATECTHGFKKPDEWLAWGPTCKYDDEEVLRLADEFISLKSDEDQIFYIYGHSYELTRRQSGCDFASFEKLLDKLSGKDDIIYATNLEIAENLMA